MAKKPQARYSEDEIDLALMTLALYSGNGRKASKTGRSEQPSDWMVRFHRRSVFGFGLRDARHS